MASVLLEWGLAGMGALREQVARDAFRAAGNDLRRMINGSVSGRELIDRGFTLDVEIALEEGASNCAPVLIDGAYTILEFTG